MTRLRGGLLAVSAIYVAACVLTLGVGGHALRPLYEGIGPSAPYRWVHPPSAFKATNIPPIAVSQDLTLTSAGSQSSGGTSTTDQQLILALPGGAIPASPGQTAVRIAITPKDPAKLGALPRGLYSDGNAYLVTADYRPSGRSIAVAAQPLDAVIRTPVSSTALMYSADGRTWTRIPDQHIPTQAAVSAAFTRFGYLLTVTNVPVVSQTSSSSTNILLLVFLGLAAVLLLWISYLWRSGRRRRPGRPHR